MDKLCRIAVDAAINAGASYADARFVSRREESVETKNGSVDGVTSSTDRGIGVRVIAGGAWGFAATSELTESALADAARKAVEIGKAGAPTLEEPVTLSCLDPVTDHVPHTAKQDPFEVPLAKRVELLLDCDRRMAEAADVVLRQGLLLISRQEQLFVSSEGSEIYQERIETGTGIEATAADGSETQRRSYPASHGGQMACRGWELVEELDLPGHAADVAREANALLSAPHFPAGCFDIILDGPQLALQVHESCGHPIELDRVLGTEAGFAGTSFLTVDKLNSGYRYGSEIVNITADATLDGGLGSFAYDDEGVPGQRTMIVDKGIFSGYLTSRETAPIIGQASQGAMRADGWVRIPLIRMTNINLLPGDWTLEEIIADTDYGFLLCTNTSWSIDDRRLNFQFGTEVAFEIVKGELGQMYRNPTYNGITPEFWASCDAISGKAPGEWRIWGVPNCGKGEPMQTARVGHGVAPARFRSVQCGAMTQQGGGDQ